MKVWERIWKHLHEAGIELKIKPFALMQAGDMATGSKTLPDYATKG